MTIEHRRGADWITSLSVALPVAAASSGGGDLIARANLEAADYLPVSISTAMQIAGCLVELVGLAAAAVTAAGAISPSSPSSLPKGPIKLELLAIQLAS